MQNIYLKKRRNAGLVQLHMEPPPTPLIKIKHNDKSENDFVKIKLHRYPMSENSDLYEFKMALFYNGDREYVFVRS